MDKLFAETERQKKIYGTILLFLGFLALATPLTPGSWLIFVGLELLGIGTLTLEKISKFFRKPK